MALAKDARFDVLVAGRSLEKAESFCKTHGGTPALLDLNDEAVDARIAALNPFIVIDAAGPFQAYTDRAPYRLATAALACKAHYLDLSDDAEFTKGISALNEMAMDADRAVLSGVSSVPALSSSIVSALAEDMADIHTIESTILPGNKAPRGLSVIRAIVGQAGAPLKIWQDNQWAYEKGWSKRKRLTLSVPQTPPVKHRWASLIGAPDLALFPSYFKARTVRFRAGLDLKLMHGGLALLSLPVRWGWLGSIAPLSRLLKWAADLLEPFGSDRGGMLVSVTGTLETGQHVTHLWTLIVEGGDGPGIPAIPAEIICGKLIERSLPAGARPALDIFTKEEAETALATRAIKTHVSTAHLTPLFHQVLGAPYQSLPRPLIDLHTVLDTRRWKGTASITRGKGLLSRCAGWLARFPPESENTEVEVTMALTPKGETWTRRFGTHRFTSYLSASKSQGTKQLQERFGFLRFQIDLAVKNGEIVFPVTRGTCLGIPLMRFLLPQSDTSEYVDAKGRACFHVKITLPIAGHVVSYKGWLEEA